MRVKCAKRIDDVGNSIICKIGKLDQSQLDDFV